MSEWLYVGITALASILSTGAVYGMFKAKVEALEADVRDIYESRKEYVTMPFFKEVIGAVRDDHKEMQKDVRTILTMLTKLNGRKFQDDDE